MLDWLLGLINKRQRQLLKENQELIKYKQRCHEMSLGLIRATSSLKWVVERITTDGQLTADQIALLRKVSQDINLGSAELLNQYKQDRKPL